MSSAQDMGYTEMISGSHLLSVPHETAGYQGERLTPIQTRSLVLRVCRQLKEADIEVLVTASVKLHS